jgi:3-oxoacyl-[acyl-carrier protein] reductase
MRMPVAAMTDGGRIVLSSSVNVRLAVHHHALYAAGKAALAGLAGLAGLAADGSP